MALVTTIPISINSPSIEGRPSSRPVIARAGKAPSAARGRVSRMTNGVSRLPNVITIDR